MTPDKKKSKFFSGHRPKAGANIRILSSQPDTSLHCETTETELAHRALCLFTPKLSLVLTAATHKGIAKVTGCIMRWFIHTNTHRPTQRNVVDKKTQRVNDYIESLHVVEYNKSSNNTIPGSVFPDSLKPSTASAHRTFSDARPPTSLLARLIVLLVRSASC